MRRHVLAAGFALAFAMLSAGPASAEWSSTIAGDYEWASWGGGEDVVALHGATETSLGDSDFHFQANGDYRYRFGNGEQISTGDIDGTLLWDLADFRLAATGGAKIFTNETFWHAGAGAEWFATPWLTLDAKVLDIVGKEQGFTENGLYYGGKVTAYWTPDLALSASVTHDNFDFGTHENDVTGKAEFRLGDGISIYAGARYMDRPVYTAFVGLKLYCNGTPATTLEDRQRSGPVDFIPGYTNLDFDT